MPPKGSEVVDFPAKLIRETELAYFLEIEGVKYWLPKSQVEWDGKEVTMPTWLAADKEIV